MHMKLNKMNESYADCMYTLSREALDQDEDSDFWGGVLDQVAGHTSFRRRQIARQDEERDVEL